jgi:Trypsin-like serine proteases, typically periplasmic, contain C-terminal PDZ domain
MSKMSKTSKWLGIIVVLVFIMSSVSVFGGERKTRGGEYEPEKVLYSEIYSEKSTNFSLNENSEASIYVQGETTLEELRETVDSLVTDEIILNKIGFYPEQIKSDYSRNDKYSEQLEYVGLYLDDNSQEVILQFKNNDNKLKQDLVSSNNGYKNINSLIKNDKISMYGNETFSIKTEEVKYSKNELEEIFKLLDKFNWSDNGIVSMWVNVPTNQVEVNIANSYEINTVYSNIVKYLLDEHNQYDIDYYSNIVCLSSGSTLNDLRDPIEERNINNNEKLISSSSRAYYDNITYGSQITTIGSGIWYSAGYPWRSGFVTCAHGVQGNYNFVYYGNNTNYKLGSTSQYSYNNYQDSAYVTFDSGKSFTNSYSMTYSNVLPSIGSRISATGAYGGSRTGTVKSNSVSIMGDTGMRFYELIQTTINTYGGDSGGPLFVDNGSRRTIYGIVKGQDNVYSYFVAFKNINH